MHIPELDGSNDCELDDLLAAIVDSDISKQNIDDLIEDY